jgi:penicillin-binding protein 1A
MRPTPDRVPPRPRRRLGWRLIKWAILFAVWGSVGFALLLVYFAWDLPRPQTALDAARRPSLTLQDRSGHVYATYGDVVGEPLRLADMPPYLPEAAIAIEDRRYFQHGAIDPIGIARAAVADLLAGRVVEGGSTIAQQVAKNLFLSNARTLRRKVQELLLTLWLEQTFTKQQILEIWLNRIYFGCGAWGVDAAAHIYFNTSARHVNLWQAAMLAGLAAAPSRYNPRVDPAAAIARTREVLAAMVRTHVLTAEQATAAAAQITLPPPPPSAGYFADWVAEQAQALLPLGADAVVRTTLDARLQAVAEAKLRALLDGPGMAAGASQGAVVALDAATGAVRAMVGGRDYRGSPYNRAVLARRQPGSAFKPFVWAAALEAGMRPSDTVLDAPIRLGSWAPHDYERRYLGQITLEDALANSINTVSVRLLLQVGGPRVVAALAHRLGITDALPDNATLALGTGDVGLLELAGAYGAFFNGGRRITPYGIAAISSDGRALAVGPPPPGPQVLSPDVAAMMVRMLAAVVSRGTGRAAALPGRTVAGKTGTSQDFRDAWFIGGTDGVIIGVWIGNDNDQPMRGVVGGGLPARLFHEIAAQATG